VVHDTESDTHESPCNSHCNCYFGRDGEDWLCEKHLLGFHESFVGQFLHRPRGGGWIGGDVMGNNDEAERVWLQSIVDGTLDDHRMMLDT
jgi:hypothetical protein